MSKNMKQSMFKSRLESLKYLPTAIYRTWWDGENWWQPDYESYNFWIGWWFNPLSIFVSVILSIFGLYYLIPVWILICYKLFKFF